MLCIAWSSVQLFTAFIGLSCGPCHVAVQRFRLCRILNTLRAKKSSLFFLDARNTHDFRQLQKHFSEVVRTVRPACSTQCELFDDCFRGGWSGQPGSSPGPFPGDWGWRQGSELDDQIVLTEGDAD